MVTSNRDEIGLKTSTLTAYQHGYEGPLKQPITCITAALGALAACGVSLQGTRVVSKCDDAPGSSNARG